VIGEINRLSDTGNSLTAIIDKERRDFLCRIAQTATPSGAKNCLNGIEHSAYYVE
jgi:hypothetical protein